MLSEDKLRFRVEPTLGQIIAPSLFAGLWEDIIGPLMRQSDFGVLIID